MFGGITSTNAGPSSTKITAFIILLNGGLLDGVRRMMTSLHNHTTHTEPLELWEGPMDDDPWWQAGKFLMVDMPHRRDINQRSLTTSANRWSEMIA
jgi:hypothetical protein